MALRILSYVALSAIAFVAGIYLSAEMHRQQDFLEGVGEIEHEGALMEFILDTADDNAQFAALKSHLAFIDRQDSKREPFGDETRMGDRTLTLLRLSAVAAHQGESTQSKGYLDQAVSFCQGAKWRTCDPDELTKVAARIDLNRTLGRDRK
jgi:hypothetical protein